MEVDIYIDDDYHINYYLDENITLKSELSEQGAHAIIRNACIKNECNYIAKVMNITEKEEKNCYTYYDIIRNEMVISKRMSDIGIAPKIYDMCLNEDEGIIIMDKYDGTLKDLLWFYQLDKTLEIKKYLRKIGDMIRKMHLNGIVHRDLNPDNILYTENGQFAIADFGAAIYSKSDKLRQIDRDYFKKIFDVYKKITNGIIYDNIWDIYLEIVSIETPDIQFLYNGYKCDDWQ